MRHHARISIRSRLCAFFIRSRNRAKSVSVWKMVARALPRVITWAQMPPGIGREKRGMVAAPRSVRDSAAKPRSEIAENDLSATTEGFWADNHEKGTLPFIKW